MIVKEGLKKKLYFLRRKILCNWVSIRDPDFDSWIEYFAFFVLRTSLHLMLLPYCILCTLYSAPRFRSRPCWSPLIFRPEVEFLDVIGTKVFGVFLLAFPKPLYGFQPPPPPSLSKSGFIRKPQIWELSGLSQDYAQKSQRNCTFVNSASGKPPEERRNVLGFMGCRNFFLCGLLTVCWSLKHFPSATISIE